MLVLQTDLLEPRSSALHITIILFIDVSRLKTNYKKRIKD